MSDNSLEKFIRPDLATLGAYSPRKAPETVKKIPPERVIKLDANENPYGCSPRVNKALAKYPDFSVYPDDAQTELRKSLGKYAGIDAKYIVAGSGSNNLIDLILRLFVSPGDEVINCIPTFDMFRLSTELCGGKLVEVRRDKDFAVDVKAVKAAINKRTRLVILANPNNPTGNLMPESQIREILATRVPVLVDEAYFEFSGVTVVPLVKRYKNLMVLRTFSKWAGLAGLRVGYGIFPPPIADYLLKIKLPYNVNVAALVAVRESFKDIDYLMGNVKAIIAERARLFRELKKIKWLKTFPSQGNFILCQVLKGSATGLRQKLEERGILVRYFDRSLLRDYIRISVGKPEHTDALIKALKEIELEKLK